MSYNYDKEKRGYVAAGSLPWKVVKSREWLVDGKIIPLHLQFIPTNRCNGNCPWCSCKEVDRKVELQWSEIQDIIEHFFNLGTKAVTITGGGEPTLHPQFENMVRMFDDYGIDVGVVTNAIKWRKEDINKLLALSEYLMWVRISITDTISGGYDVDGLKNVVYGLDHSDVGFSFTVPENVSVETAVKICELANEHPNVTHIRFVSDILDPNDRAMVKVTGACAGITDKAIFQSRSEFTKGKRHCFISLLKPIVDATGYVFPCCGVQYAVPSKLRHMPDMLRMCHWKDYGMKTLTFDGSVCQKCYYTDYNDVLEQIISPIPHENFV